jgi:hypothetical protein
LIITQGISASILTRFPLLFRPLILIIGITYTYIFLGVPMKKKVITEPPFYIEDGIRTYEAIAALGLRHTVFDIQLNDGDTVAITGEIAEGVILIRDSLKHGNWAKMNEMDFLNLLHIYDEALKSGMLIPSKLKLWKDVAGKQNA